MHLFKLIKRFKQRLENRRALKVLLEADERLLRDIGITREGVIHARQMPLWADTAEAVKKMREDNAARAHQHPPPLYAQQP